MKIFSQILAVVLILVAVLGTAGCGNTGNTGDKTDVSFNGGTITVATWTDAKPELGKSDGGDASYYAIEQACEKYDCKLNWAITTQSDHFNKLVSYGLSGKVYADIVMSHSWNHVELIKQNLLAPTDAYLEAMSDEERAHWVTDLCYFNGHYYGLHPAGRVTLPQLCMFYNRTRLKELNLSDPQELAKKGEWTWKKFYDYCIAATNKNQDKYGVHAYNLYNVLGAGNGVKTVVLDETDGKYKNGFTNTDAKENNLACVEFIQKLAQNGALMGEWVQNSMDDAENAFLDGQTLFTFAQNGERLKKFNMNDFGVITAPIADWNADKTLYNVTESYVYWAFPTSNNYKIDDLAAFWQEAQTTWDPDRGDAYYDFDEDEYKEELLAREYTSMDDVQFLFDMKDRVKVEPSLDLSCSLGSLVAWDIFGNVIIGKMTPAAAIGAVDNQIQAKIDEALNGAK